LVITESKHLSYFSCFSQTAYLAERLSALLVDHGTFRVGEASEMQMRGWLSQSWEITGESRAKLPSATSGAAQPSR
jgi:hypothetical protein